MQGSKCGLLNNSPDKGREGKHDTQRGSLYILVCDWAVTRALCLGAVMSADLLFAAVFSLLLWASLVASVGFAFLILTARSEASDYREE
jgi:hypothetical protein